jgi:N-methylhydantoinase B
MTEARLDAVTIKILWDRLVSIVDEATVVQYRTAFSTVVQEANDFACSILTCEGATLASSGFGLPSFVATQAITLQHILPKWPVSEMQPGDVFITNDPWIATGQSMDITILAPIFVAGRVVAVAGSVAHAPDLGGAQRWNLSTDIFDDAIFLPPMKLFAGGVPNETLFTLLRANSRLPELTIGDLEAQLAAVRIITMRVTELMAEYGFDDLDSVSSAIYSRSEAAMRKAVEAIPDGVYEGEVWSDPFFDPLAEEQRAQDPILIKATVRVEGSELSVDFAGSSPQRAGSFNSIWTFTTAYALYSLRLVLVPNFPNNAGFYRPLHIICPEGTVVNARFPAATLSRHAVGHQVPDAIYTALSQVLPDAVFAHSGSAPSWDVLLMGNDYLDRPYHRLVIVNGGTGGGFRSDGLTAAFPANLSNTPVEVLETVMPVVCEAKEIIPDSAGAGRHRGGFGQRTVLRARKPFRFSLVNARVLHPAEGLLGGRSGRPGRVIASGVEVPPGSDGEIAPGQTLILETPGGGGLGPLEDRSRDLIQAELVSGMVTTAWLIASST